MEIPTKTVQIWVSHFHDKVVNEDTVEHDVLIVPSPFCAMRHINDVRYLPGYEASELERVKNVRKNNVKFYQTHFPDAPTDFQYHEIMAIRALQNIVIGKELY